MIARRYTYRVKPGNDGERVHGEATHGEVGGATAIGSGG